jgi:NTE family protein
VKRPIAVVTTFGLARTPAQVGMLEVLAERGIVADYVVGTSLAAVNAAALAAGRDPQEVREFWSWMHDEVLGSPVRTIARGLTTRQAAKQEAQVRARIATLLPRTFDDLLRPLRLLATELETGAEVVLDSGDLAGAVMASCALPGAFPPVELDGAHLIDGGLVAGMPLRAVPDDARTIIVLDTGHSAVDPEVAVDYRWWEVGALSYAHQIRGQAVNALVQAAARVPVVLLSTDAGRLLDFADPDAVMRAGREAAEVQVDALPGRLRRGIYNLPPGLDEFESLQVLRVPGRSG